MAKRSPRKKANRPKASGDAALLAQLSKATEKAPHNSQAPAGSNAVKNVIEKHEGKAVNPYNIRLSDADAEIIENLVDALRANGHRRASAADAVRVALRALPADAQKNPQDLLG